MKINKRNVHFTKFLGFASYTVTVHNPEQAKNYLKRHQCAPSSF